MVKKIKKYAALLASLCLALCLSSPAIAGEEAKNTTIMLFHTNDVHSRAEQAQDWESGDLTQIGYARMKSYIDGQTADLKLVLDAGDVFHGQSFATLTQGKSIAKLLKAVGYDAITPGNHDFNYGKNALPSLGRLAGVQLLSANVRDQNGLVFNPYMVKEVNGIKIGIFGLCTPETACKTNPANVEGLDFGTKESIIADAQSTVRILKETEKADIIICLSHLGSEPWAEVSSQDIARSVEGISVIIDGHSHSVLENYKVNNTCIASTGEYLNNLGVVCLTIDTQKNISVQTQLLGAKELADVPQDEGILKLLEDEKQELEPILSKVVGNTPIDLDGEREHVRGQSTNLGRLIGYSMIAETGADIAINNGGAIRASISAGEITQGDIVNVLPFGNYVVTTTITGEKLLQAFNESMICGEGRFPQYAGLQLEVYPVTLTVGEENYIQYKVASMKINGEEVDPGKVYTMAINDYLRTGGELSQFSENSVINEYSTLDEIFIRYIQNANIEAISQEPAFKIVSSPSEEESKPSSSAEENTGNSPTEEVNSTENTVSENGGNAGSFQANPHTGSNAPFSAVVCTALAAAVLAAVKRKKK